MKSVLPWFAEEYKKMDPDFAGLVAQVIEKAMQPEALDKKTVHLIVLALDAAKGAGEGVGAVAEQARAAGASEQEIKEALRLAYYVSGMDTVKAFLSASEFKGGK
ncbi:MAG: carboxymuconolactone decarboxylase family protein [Syntrophomonadaceae bacterium]|nr:carboxymuconolactone decarboxylase family protein [Syntrophomonadaceae bacterium]